MTKAELIDAVADAAGVSKADAERTIGAFFDTVVSSTNKGDKVAWPGFGSFSTTKRPARTGRNPQTGAPVNIAASTAMRLLSDAGEARAVRDVERIVRGRGRSSVMDPAPDGLLVVPWLESQFAIDGTLFPRGIPAAWLGQSIEAHGIPTGTSSSISLAVRWHGARPAVLWEQAGGPVELTAPTASPTWSSREISGEVLWPAPG